MDFFDGAISEALLFLAPGFVSAWVLFALTADRELSDLQRVIQALIFSVLVGGIVAVIAAILSLLSMVFAIGDWTKKVEFAWSIFTAGVFGLGLAWLVNSDKLYALLRRLGLTGQSSRPSVWYSCFRDNPETYAVLHLHDDRRVFGWVSEWPSLAGKGHIRLDRVSWLSGDAVNQVESSLPESVFLMVDVTQIKWVEFLPKTPNLTKTN